MNPRIARMLHARLRHLAAPAALAALCCLPAAAAPAPIPAPAPAPTAFQVRVTGAGAPLILIPGLASSGAVWDGTVARYCAGPRPRHQCHVLTLAGFAGVPAIGGPLLPQAEQQLSDYLAASRFDRPIVVGHSLGGFLALKLAADHPDQVGKLVIVDSLPALAATQVPSLTAPQIREMGEGMRARMLAQDAETAAAGSLQMARMMVTAETDVERVVGWGKRSDRATVVNAMADMMGEDLRQDIARVKAPTLVLGSWIAYRQYGAKPQFQQMYETQYRQLAGVTVEMADSARHFIMFDDPAWMYDRIDHFLK